MSVPANANKNTVVLPMRVVPSMVRPGVPRDGIGFHVKFPLVIDHLAVAKRALAEFFSGKVGKHHEGNLTVDFLDASPDGVLVEDLIASLNFSRHDLKMVKK